jgi:hypothetical protein
MLTLYTTPVIYLALERWRRRGRSRERQAPGPKGARAVPQS